MQSAVAISALVGTSANICTGSPRRGVAAPRDFDSVVFPVRTTLPLRVQKQFMLCCFLIVVGDDIRVFAKRIVKNHFTDIIAVFNDFFVGNRCNFVVFRFFRTQSGDQFIQFFQR